MRLIAWNANYCNRKGRSLEESVSLLEPLNPDIIVLSETALPEVGNALEVYPTGQAAPCLAVIARNGYELHPCSENDGAPPLMAGFSVSGPLAFKLLAAWPVKGALSYHRILMSGLERYASFLASGPAVFAGDLNSSSRVSDQVHTHPKFVMAAANQGLVSVYHEKTGELHGQESIGTYRHRDGKSFCLDYCFVSRSLLERCSIEVQRGNEWNDRSDHWPLVLDLGSG